MLLAVAIYTAAAVVVVCVLKWLLTPTKQLFPGPSPWGGLGTLPHMIFSKPSVSKYRYLYFHKMHEQYGPIVQLSRFHMPILLLRDPDDVKRVLLELKDDSDRPGHALRAIVPEGILGLRLHDPNWAIHRKVTAMQFAERYMKLYAKEIVRQAVEKLVPAWRSNSSDGVLNVETEFTRLTLDIIGACGFGSDLQTFVERNEGSDHFLNSGGELSQEVNVYITFRKFAPLVNFFRPAAAKKLSHARALWTGLIDKARSAAGDNRTMLSEMLDAHADGRISDRGLEDTMISLLLAGHETTSHTLSHLSLLLARNPHVQTKLREEVRAVLGGEPSSSLSYEHIQKLTYAKWCVLEALRLYPTVPGIPRMVERPFELRGKVLPAGSMFFVTNYSMGLSKENWGDDVYAFRPERHGEERSPFAVLPFGHGPRTCPGRRFALQEAMLIISIILNEFTIGEDFTHPPPPPPVNHATLMPDNAELWLRVSPLS